MSPEGDRRAIATLDALPAAALAEELGHCCGARRWVAAVAARRPFGSRAGLLEAADAADAALASEDWLEAFSHHPRIGDVDALRLRFASAQSKTWSQGEQSGVAGADDAVLERLQSGNLAYEQRFGYLFIVCATGKSAAEMLAILESRLAGDPAAELPIAAGEQRKITRLRLHKLLDRLADFPPLLSTPGPPPAEAPMNKTLDDLGGLLAPLHRAQAQFATTFPGDSPLRQPVHTVYGGAQLFKADTALKLGAAARRHAAEYFPDAASLAEVYGLAPELAAKVFARVTEKLEREAVEDLRIDFEDGYGHRPDAEEDQQAVTAAAEVAQGLAEGTLPPFLGIRIKPLTQELETRSIRTLDLFLTALAAATGGKLPPNFVITLPKVTLREEVAACVALLEKLERELGFASGALRLELMVETTQSLIDDHGRAALPELVAAAQGRCASAHFGVYDYTASCNLIAAHQRMRHRVCDFARHLMQVSLVGRGVNLSDGATNVMPVGPHRAPAGGMLSPSQEKENRSAVHRISKLNYDDVRHSLEGGFYQGWDLHPAQLPIRYTAVYAFFLEQLGEMTARLSTFIQKSAQATLLGEVFDDAATGQALLNYFLRGLACGAISDEEILATGLSLDEIRTRSFKAILAGRRARAAEKAGSEA